MKFDDKTWGFIEESLDDFRSRGKELSDLANEFRISVESPLFTPMVKSELSVVRSLAFLVHRTYNLNMEGVFSALSWFMFDNNFGQNHLTCYGISKEERQINTYNDLRKYLEEEIDNDVQSTYP